MRLPWLLLTVTMSLTGAPGQTNAMQHSVSLSTIVDDWWQWICLASWQLVVVIIAISVIAWLCRRGSPRLRHALWFLVLLKVFVPPSVSSPTGLANWVPAVQYPAMIAPSFSESNASENALTLNTTSSAPDVGAESSTTPQKDRASLDRSWLMVGWLAGALGFWCIVFLRYCKVRQIVESCTAIDEGPLRVSMEQAAMRLGTQHSPDLCVTEAFTSPMLLGVLHPCVVLPRRLIDEASSQELSAVLTHELAHLRRHDTWVGWLQVIAQGLFWFHPLVWWAGAQLRHEREEACDELVLSNGGIEPTSYGETMLRVLTSARAQSLANSVSLGVFERGTNLQTRLEKIMNFESTRRPFGVGAWLLIAMAGAILIPMSSVSQTRLAAQDGGNAATQAASKPAAKQASPYPVIMNTVPKIGETDVKTSTNEIRVTFDRDMAGGMSWTGEPPEFPPTVEGQKARWINARTCVLPVKLDQGKFYRVGINSKSFQNFRSASGAPSRPSTIYFATEGATPEIIAKATTPQIVKLVPANGATDVDPTTASISVTFNVSMGSGMSWTGGGPAFPTIPVGGKPVWSKDRKTCTLPVKLESDHAYELGLNSPRHNNFQSASGVPIQPVHYQFRTRSQ